MDVSVTLYELYVVYRYYMHQQVTVAIFDVEESTELPCSTALRTTHALSYLVM